MLLLRIIFGEANSADTLARKLPWAAQFVIGRRLEEGFELTWVASERLFDKMHNSQPPGWTANMNCTSLQLLV